MVSKDFFRHLGRLKIVFQIQRNLKSQRLHQIEIRLHSAGHELYVQSDSRYTQVDITPNIFFLHHHSLMTMDARDKEDTSMILQPPPQRSDLNMLHLRCLNVTVPFESISPQH